MGNYRARLGALAEYRAAGIHFDGFHPTRSTARNDRNKGEDHNRLSGGLPRAGEEMTATGKSTKI